MKNQRLFSTALDIKEVTEEEAKKNFSAYLDRVVSHGERFIICRDSKPLAMLRPVKAPATGAELLEFFKRWPKLDEGELDVFESDMDEARPR